MNEQNTPNLQPAIDALLSRFHPAESVDESTHQFKTKEIHEAIKEIDPGIDLSLQQVSTMMNDAGFHFESIRGSFGLDFRWILTEK